MPTLIRWTGERAELAEDPFTAVADDTPVPPGDVIISLTRFQLEGERLLSEGMVLGGPGALLPASGGGRPPGPPGGGPLMPRGGGLSPGRRAGSVDAGACASTASGTAASTSMATAAIGSLQLVILGIPFSYVTLVVHRALARAFPLVWPSSSALFGAGGMPPCGSGSSM